MIAMFNNEDELKAQEVLLDELRNLFRHEYFLKAEGWYSEAEFLQAVLDAISDYLEKLLQK